MSYLLTVTSDDRPANQTTDNFEVSFNPPIKISGNWEIALESASIWYAWHNISTDFNNQVFRYYNGTTWKNITIPNGLYTIENLNSYLQSIMKVNGDYTAGSPDTFYINIAPNYNTFKLQITISNSYQVDLTVGTLYQLFGFTQKIVTTTEEGVNNVDITNGINRILIHVDCVSGSYKSSGAGDVIYSFNADGPPSSLLVVKPNHLLHLPVNKTGYLQSIRIYLTDQRDRRLNLNGEEVSASFYLRSKK